MKQYKLMGPDGNFYFSESKGQLGGYSGKKNLWIA